MLVIQEWDVDRLIPYVRNPRRNDHAVNNVAAGIREYGFKVPVIARSDGTVVDGHLRLKAALKLGLKTVPVVLADDLSEAQIKAFRISVNRMADLAEWDTDLLGLEIDELKSMNVDLDLTGFDADSLNDLLDMDDGWQTDIDVVDKYGETLDGAKATVKITVESDQTDRVKELITSFLDSEGVQYEIK